MLVSGLNSTLKLLDKSTGEILAEYVEHNPLPSSPLIPSSLHRFKGHHNKKYRIDNGLLANDSLVASGSEDGALYVWSLLEVSCLLLGAVNHLVI